MMNLYGPSVSDWLVRSFSRGCSLRYALIAATLVALVTSPATAHRFDKPDARPPELGPLVSGTSSYVDGTFVWTDYAYDDRGANTVETSLVGPRGGAPGTASRSGGDTVYPDWAEPGNTADLIQLQISRGHSGLRIRAILETLVDPELPLLGVAFDTDSNPATGAANLPGGQWPSLDPLGIELLAVVSSEGTKLLAYEGTTWSVIGHYPADVDAESNVMDTRIHGGARSRLHVPRHGEWRVFGVLGLVDPETGSSWLEGTSPIFDLAFVGGEPQILWQEMKQSDILAGELTSNAAAATLDFSKMRSRATELVDELAPGFKTFLYHSDLDLPEGTPLAGAGVNLGQHEFLGPYQPYQVFIPETMPEGNPLLVSLHGANNNHLLAIFTVPDGAYVGTSRELTEDPFLIGMFVPDFGVNGKTAATAKVWPLGRGETLGYRGISEIDVLEVTRDATLRLGTDPDRVTLDGASMGGFGAYRLGTRYPDMWAAIIPTIGGGAADRNLFENLTNVPVRQINGALDPLVGYAPALEDAALLDALELPFVFYGLLDRGHDPSANSICVRDQAAEFIRNPNPSRVVYVVDPQTFQLDPTRDLDIVYDSAYWISSIELADPDSEGSVTGVSAALPHSVETVVRNDVVTGNTVEARDLCGPNPAFPPGWSPAFPAGESWREISLALIPGPDEPLANSLDLALSNVAAVTLDLRRAGFDPRESGSVHVSSDTGVELTLSNLRRGARVEIDGSKGARKSRPSGSSTIELPAGEHTVTVGIRGCRHRFFGHGC